VKSIAANGAGMVQGAVFSWLWIQFGGASAILGFIGIGVFSAVMTIDGDIPLLAAIPGQFARAAVCFGNLGRQKGDIRVTLANTPVCMLIGNSAGTLSAKLPGLFKQQKAQAAKS
jgi:hypothetical protein